MQMLRAFALGLAAVPIVGMLVVTVARADTEHCVDHGEFNETDNGLTVDQVANRYDIYGQLLDDSNARFRRGYRTCWAPDTRQAVAVFSYDTGRTVNWYVRDI